MTSTEYEAARKAYWDAQTAFRQRAIKEIIDLIPEEYDAVVVMHLNEGEGYATMRHWLGGGDEPGLPETDDVEAECAINEILRDMELFSWDEAESALERYDSQSFIIRRES